MPEEIFIEPTVPEGDPQEQINALRSQLTMLQRTLDGMRRETIVDNSGRQFTVMAKRGPFLTEASTPLSPYFTVSDGNLRGYVSPHGFLSANARDIFVPVVPTLGGRKITENPAPFMPLSEGKYHLMLKTANGRGFLDFVKGDELPTRSVLLEHPNDWIVLARFTVKKTTVEDLELFSTVPQSQVLYPPQFTPLLSTEDGVAWKCETVDGFVWPMGSSSTPIQATSFQGNVAEGDKLMVKIYTDADNIPNFAEVIKSKSAESTVALPSLEDQGARAGAYHIEICEFKKADENGETFSLYPKMTHSGPVIWHMISFENAGDGEGKLLMDYTEPRKLKVKSIKNVGDGKKIIKESKGVSHVPVKTIKGSADGSSVTTGIEIDDGTETLTVKPKGGSGEIIFTDCDGAEVGRIKAVDGMVEVISGSVRVGRCDGSSSSSSSIP